MTTIFRHRVVIKMNGPKREIIAMILAGGQGSRLKELTKQMQSLLWNLAENIE